MHRRLGGGSLTLLPVLCGMPARGEAPRRSVDMAAYKHLSQAQREKLVAALETAQKDERLVREEEGSLRTEVEPAPLHINEDEC
jgi:hypothetical protein